MAIDPSQILPDQSQDPSQQQPQAPPVPANNAQNAGPVKAGLRGVLARMMGNFSYGAGQAMLKAAGDETDAEKSTRIAMTAHLNAQTQLAQSQATMVPVQLPNGATIHLPPKMAADLMKQQMANQGKTDVADINTQATLHKPLSIPGVGGFTWDDTKNGYTPIQGAQIPQHQLAPGEAQKLGFAPETTQVPESIYSQATRLQPLVRSGIQWKETSPGVWQPLTTTSTRSYGAPPKGGTAPQAGTPSAPNPSQPSHPPGPRGAVYGNGPIYAFDPKNNETVLTTPAEAQKNGYTNTRKTTGPEIMNDTQLNNRLTDVATKIERYRNAMSAPVSLADRNLISGLLSSDKLQLGAHGFGAGVEIPVDRFNQLIDSFQAGNLSPAGKNALLAYLNARESMMGYTRVLTGSSRSSDTSLGLNLQALPSPVMPKDYINNGIGQFEENVKLAGRGLPRMPGIPQAKDVLGQQSQPAPTVRVKLSDGRTGTIPVTALPKYQKMGASIIQ